MKLEWIERDRDDHEVRTATKTLEPSQELSVAGASAIRLVSDRSQGCTLQIIKCDPPASATIPSHSNPPTSMLRSTVAAALGAGEDRLAQFRDLEVRALANLLNAAGKELPLQRLASQLGGLFWEPTVDDINDLLDTLNQNLAQIGMAGLLARRGDTVLVLAS